MCKAHNTTLCSTQTAFLFVSKDRNDRKDITIYCNPFPSRLTSELLKFPQDATTLTQAREKEELQTIVFLVRGRVVRRVAMRRSRGSVEMQNLRCALRVLRLRDPLCARLVVER